MSKLSDIRAAIVAKLNSVPNIGLVHDYERFAKATKEFQDLYTASGKLLGWNVRRIKKTERRDNTRTEIVNTWRIRGFRSLEDAVASELLFDELIETVSDAFRIDVNLGGAVISTVLNDSAGIQLDQSEPVMFCGVLCHSASLTLSTRHYI